MPANIADTHRLINHLKHRKFSETQAEGVVEALNELDFSHVATKTDIEQLELRMTIKLGGLIVVGVGALGAMNLFS